MTLADIGAGAGILTRLFSEEVGRRRQVFPADFASNFLEHIMAGVVMLQADQQSGGALNERPPQRNASICQSGPR